MSIVFYNYTHIVYDVMKYYWYVDVVAGRASVRTTPAIVLFTLRLGSFPPVSYKSKTKQEARIVPTRQSHFQCPIVFWG